MKQQQIATKHSNPQVGKQTKGRDSQLSACSMRYQFASFLSAATSVSGLSLQSHGTRISTTRYSTRDNGVCQEKTTQQRTVRFRLHRAHFTRSTMSSPNNRCWGRLRLCRSINSRSCTCSSWRWNGLCDTLGHHHQHVRYRLCCAQLDIVHDLGLPVEVPSLLHQTSRFLGPLKHALREVKGDQIQICIETT